MRRRSLLPLFLALLTAMAMASVSVLAAPPPEDSGLAIRLAGLPDVSHHKVSKKAFVRFTTPSRPSAVWLVRDGDRWRAFSNRSAHPRACDVEWRPERRRFTDGCVGVVYDRTGLNVAGPAHRPLEEWSVRERPEGWLEVDLAHPIR